jgi:hypothetical protein
LAAGGGDEAARGALAAGGFDAGGGDGGVGFVSRADGVGRRTAPCLAFSSARSITVVASVYWRTSSGRARIAAR